MLSHTQLRNVRLQKWRDKILAIFQICRKDFVTSTLGVIYSAAFSVASIPRSSTSKISAAYGGIGPPGFGRAP